jgi:hypothetical protein
MLLENGAVRTPRPTRGDWDIKGEQPLVNFIASK